MIFLVLKIHLSLQCNLLGYTFVKKSKNPEKPKLPNIKVIVTKKILETLNTKVEKKIMRV